MPAAVEKEESGLLPKRERIVSRGRIKGLLKRKRFHFSSPLLNVVAEENNNSFPRWVVICSKRLGNAVVRNRTRRTTLAAISNIRLNINKNIDIVVIPKSTGLGSRALEVILTGSLAKINEVYS
ncbi:MAG: ribonuclease P protein component [Candidatus Margulisbacteria bacterium]|nr:ribonuclease P protein component [Candidatus Margulisiibacteriota bacterium]